MVSVKIVYWGSENSNAVLFGCVNDALYAKKMVKIIQAMVNMTNNQVQKNWRNVDWIAMPDFLSRNGSRPVFPLLILSRSQISRHSLSKVHQNGRGKDANAAIYNRLDGRDAWKSLSDERTTARLPLPWSANVHRIRKIKSLLGVAELIGCWKLREWLWPAQIGTHNIFRTELLKQLPYIRCQRYRVQFCGRPADWHIWKLIWMPWSWETQLPSL